MGSKRPIAQMLVLGAIASAILVAVALAIDWFPQQGSDKAKDIDLLWDVTLVASVPIFVLVMSIVIYSVIKFRARPGDDRDGAPIHGNAKLEVIWVVVPFVIVSALAVYGWIVLDNLEDRPAASERVVKVTGQQFTWNFEYPGEGGVKSNQLILPAGEPVKFEITSPDVIHSFWVPDFRLKMDAVPGISTEWRTTPIALGTHDVVCAELCGIGHATMRQTVQVVSREEFDKFIAQRQQGGAAAGAAPGSEEMVSAGKELFTSLGCGACHTLADAGSQATIGPPLDELARVARERKDGRPEDYVGESIVDPGSFTVEGYPEGTMPSYNDQLTPQEVEALVEYLLEAGSGEKKSGSASVGGGEAG